MGFYQYLVSSLPALSLDAPPPFSPDEFRFKCQGVLAKADLAELDRAATPARSAAHRAPAPVTGAES